MVALFRFLKKVDECNKRQRSLGVINCQRGIISLLLFLMKWNSNRAICNLFIIYDRLWIRINNIVVRNVHNVLCICTFSQGGGDNWRLCNQNDSAYYLLQPVPCPSTTGDYEASGDHIVAATPWNCWPNDDDGGGGLNKWKGIVRKQRRRAAQERFNLYLFRLCAGICLSSTLDNK